MLFPIFEIIQRKGREGLQEQFLSKPGQNNQGILMSQRQLEVNTVMEDTELHKGHCCLRVGNSDTSAHADLDLW